jgi:hypothetical protein
VVTGERGSHKDAAPPGHAAIIVAGIIVVARAGRPMIHLPGSGAVAL